MNNSEELNLGSCSLAQPGMILLISCYELGHQPIGLAQPLGFLIQRGYAPSSLDLAREDFDEQQVKLAKFIGISVPMHAALTLGCEVAKRIRCVNDQAHICFYGLYASLNTQFLLENLADSVIGGEYEVPLVNLIQTLTNPQICWDGENITDLLPRINLEGVSIAGSLKQPFLGKIFRHSFSSQIDQPESPALPIPQRTQLPHLKEYARLVYREQEELVGYVEASRGCLHTCLHCPIVPVYRGRFFVVPDEVVLADIRQQVSAGALHITFGDPDFLNGPSHSLNIARAMHEEFPKLTFDFTVKIEHILQHRTLFKEFSQLGCLFVISAVESFSDMVLLHLEKGHKRRDILTALDIIQSSGMVIRPSLVSFTPWTTMEDYFEMISLVKQYELIDCIDPVQYSIRLLVPPGSSLLTPSQVHPLPISKWISHLDQESFQFHWIHPDPRMDSLQQAVTQLVEKGVKVGKDSEEIFVQLCELVCETGGFKLSSLSRKFARNPQRGKPPRMTEPWFCCAEPTSSQLQSIHHAVNKRKIGL